MEKRDIFESECNFLSESFYFNFDLRQLGKTYGHAPTYFLPYKGTGNSNYHYFADPRGDLK